MRHYVTVYCDNGKMYAEAWLQINIFGRCCYFWRKRQEVTIEAIDGVFRPVMG